ncbi:hypothetical protein HDU84_009531, partial [Entophlyctis sp. JEL0112]
MPSSQRTSSGDSAPAAADADAAPSAVSAPAAPTGWVAESPEADLEAGAPGAQEVPQRRPSQSSFAPSVASAPLAHIPASTSASVSARHSPASELELSPTTATTTATPTAASVAAPEVPVGADSKDPSNPIRNMLAWAMSAEDADDDDEDFIYADNQKHHQITKSIAPISPEDTDVAPRVPLSVRLKSTANPGTTTGLLGGTSNTGPSATSTAISLSQVAATLSSPSAVKRERGKKTKLGPSSTFGPTDRSFQSPILGSGSSALSSLAVGADFASHNIAKRPKSHNGHNSTRSLHYPHQPVHNSDEDAGKDSASQFFYNRPVVQKRMKSSGASSVSNSSDQYRWRLGSNNVGLGNFGYFAPHEIERRRNSAGGLLSPYSSQRSSANERTRLLENSHRHPSGAGWSGSNVEIDAGRVLVSVSVEEDGLLGNGTRFSRTNSKSSIIGLCSTICLMLALLLSFVLLFSNPLTPLALSEKSPPWVFPSDVWQPIVTKISHASADLYSFEMELMAINWGLIWDVVLDSADLEVFVEASGEKVHLSGSGSSSQELLAHIAQLSSPGIFPPHSLTLDAKAEIAIDHPSSTVGK